LKKYEVTPVVDDAIEGYNFIMRKTAGNTDVVGPDTTLRRSGYWSNRFALRLAVIFALATGAILNRVSWPFPFPFTSIAPLSQVARAESLFSADEQRDFYQFVDRDGVVHFVDSLEKVPLRYRNKVIVRKEMSAAQQSTSVDIVDNRMLVPVSIKSGADIVKAFLLLDTGTTITCITGSMAARLKIDLENTRLVSMGLADGKMIDVHIATVDFLSVGDRIKSPFEIGILPDSGKLEKIDGYLGLDFLGTFQFQLDFQNRLIRWQ